MTTSPAATNPYGQLAKLNGSHTLSWQIYEVLEHGIVAGRLKPGTRILPDELAAYFGISRIPVREALRALDANGWVKIHPRIGVYVTERTSSELSDLFEMRLLLEPQLARLAAQRRTDEQLATLEQLVAEGHHAADAEDATGFSLLNTSFHGVIASCSHNAVLERAVINNMKRVAFYLTTVSPSRIQESATQHAELAEAIRFRDGEAAADATIQHIRGTELDIRTRVARVESEDSSSPQSTGAGVGGGTAR